jgi:hypothetical protein
MRRLVSLIIFCFSLHAYSAGQTLSGPVLLLAVPDQHSHLGRWPHLIYTLSKLSQDFMGHHPDGTVIYVNVGDFVGAAGKYTIFSNTDIPTDYGQIGLDIWYHLAHYAEVVDVLGNHEEFDWSPGDGNFQFIKNRSAYLEKLSKLKGREAKILAGNLVPAYNDYGKLIGSHTDIPLRSGGYLRFVGMVLEAFREKTTYDFYDPFTFIHGYGGEESMRPIGHAIEEELELGLRDGVPMVMAIHERAAEVRNIALASAQWRAQPGQSPEMAGLRLPVWITGHQHKNVILKAHEEGIYQAGSNGDLMRIELNSQFQVVGRPLRYGEEEQRRIFERRPVVLRPHEQLAFDLAQNKIAELGKALNMRQVVQTAGISCTKEDLKKGPHVVGFRICEMMRQYGLTQVDRYKEEVIEDVVVFLNPSGFRLDQPIAPGFITPEDIFAMFPFSKKAGKSQGVQTRAVPGAELEDAFFALRDKRKKLRNYSPLTNMYLRESVDGEKRRLEIFGKEGWQPIQRSAKYLLITDDWLGANGEKLDIFKVLFTDFPNPMLHPPLSEIVEAHAGLFNCPKLLAFVSEHWGVGEK